jgi:hypothetical protein
LKQLPILHQIRELDTSIRDRIATDDDSFPDPPQEILDEDYEENIPAEPDADIPEADAFTPELFDNLLSAKVLLPKGCVLVPTTVIGQKRDTQGNPIGVASSNPILDTRVYDVQFLDRHTETFAANVIAEKIIHSRTMKAIAFFLLMKSLIMVRITKQSIKMRSTSCIMADSH